MAAGRPSKYKSRYCEDLIAFFDVEPYEDREIEHYDKDGNVKWTDFKRVANRLPTLRDFAKKIGVHIDSLYEWQKRHKEFSEAVTRAEEIRKWFLIENGLNGCYNPAFGIFVAKNITDMRDRVEHTGKDGEPIEANVKHVPDDKLTDTIMKLLQ